MNLRTLSTLALIAFVFVSPLAVRAASDGDFDESSYTTTNARPTFTGEAEGVSSVRILIEDGKGKDIYRSGKLKVRDDAWKARPNKALKVGNYTVTLYGPRGVKKETLATTTLTITPKGGATAASSGGKTSGALTASLVPLLMGGQASSGATVPVMYLKLSNPGSAPASIEGVRLTENGTAPDSVVIGWTTNDDKGASRTTVGGTEGSTQFKSGVAYVPLAATIPAGGFRIYTIKAILSAYSGSYFGKTLAIDVASVTSAAKISGTFPIRGTTFTLVY